MPHEASWPCAASVAVKIKVNGISIKVWVDGTLKINTTDSTHAAGAVALGGDQPKFHNLQIGYDNNADDDIIDVGDDVVRNFTFAGSGCGVALHALMSMLLSPDRRQFHYLNFALII